MKGTTADWPWPFPVVSVKSKKQGECGHAKESHNNTRETSLMVNYSHSRKGSMNISTMTEKALILSARCQAIIHVG